MSDARETALRIYRSVLNELRPENLIAANCRVHDGSLEIQGLGLPLSTYRRVLVAGAGKASCGLAEPLLELLGKRVAGGLIVTKYGHGMPLGPIEVIEAAHPIPDDASLQAGERMLKFAHSRGKGDLVLFLLSGGASSLMEALNDGLGLTDITDLTARMLKSGASIGEINTARRSMSRIKAGGLATAFGDAEVVCLVLNDVIGGDLNMVGSGPLLRSDGPAIPHVVLADNSTAVNAAVATGTREGLAASALKEPLTGEARVEAKYFARQATAPNTLIVAGGEPVVTIRGEGLGGRCQEFACAAASVIADQSVVILAGSTDGTDGPTDVGAAIVNGSSSEEAKRNGQTVEAALSTNDSFHFLEACDGLIRTGPTQCNVNDIYLLINP